MAQVITAVIAISLCLDAPVVTRLGPLLLFSGIEVPSDFGAFGTLPGIFRLELASGCWSRHFAGALGHTP